MTDLILNPELKKFSKNASVFKSVKSKNDLSKSDELIYDGYLIDSDEKTTRSVIASLKSKEIKLKIAVLGRDDLFNRRIIETMKINYLVSPENFVFHKTDTLKQRNSGLNHVIAKLAKQKNVSVLINFSDISNLSNKSKKEKSIILAKIIQNIKICRKAKCEIKIATFARAKSELLAQNDLRVFVFSIGMSSQQVRDSVLF